MAKVKTSMIRALHAHLGQILEDFDARNSGAEAEDGAGSGLGSKTLEETDAPKPQDEEGPPETPGTPRKPAVTNSNQLVAAQDAAPAGIRNPSNGRTHVVQVFDTPRMPSKVLKARQPSTADAWLNGMQDKIAADAKARSDSLFTSGKK